MRPGDPLLPLLARLELAKREGDPEREEIAWLELQLARADIEMARSGSQPSLLRQALRLRERLTELTKLRAARVGSGESPEDLASVHAREMPDSLLEVFVKEYLTRKCLVLSRK